MHEPPRKRKLFAGVALDDHARAACGVVADELRRSGFAARYESADKLHVTLAFLGFVEPARVEAMEAALAGVASGTPAFLLTLDKLGAFPHERKARVTFLGARLPGEAFRSVAARIRNAYEQLGFAFAQDAVAHVTIARAKSPFQPLKSLNFAPIAVNVGDLALFESLPDPARHTSRYEIVRRCALSAG